MVQIDHLQHQRKGILYYFLSTLMLALMLFSYIFGTTTINVMDVMGWVFFTLSCLSHAAILLLPALLGYALLARLRHPHLATTWFVALVALLMVVLMLNRQVYQLYRFHINGIILNMFFGSGAREIFNFDGTMLLKEGGHSTALRGCGRSALATRSHAGAAHTSAPAVGRSRPVAAGNACGQRPLCLWLVLSTTCGDQVENAHSLLFSTLSNARPRKHGFQTACNAHGRRAQCLGLLLSASPLKSSERPTPQHRFSLHRLLEQAHADTRNDAPCLSLSHRKSMV